MYKNKKPIEFYLVDLQNQNEKSKRLPSLPRYLLCNFNFFQQQNTPILAVHFSIITKWSCEHARLIRRARGTDTFQSTSSKVADFFRHIVKAMRMSW